MKKILLTAFAAIFTLAAMAQNDGSVCEKAIYVDSTLVQKVEADQVYWFTAFTDDLPLKVYFLPNEEVEADPEVYVDFTCQPGVYDDENVKAIVDLAASMDVYFPLGAEFDTIMQEGRKTYTVSYERDLLELLAILGVDYSIPVYVSFRTPVAGSVQMDNVKTVTQCTEVCQRVEMRDTLYLQANKDAMFYFPVKEWENKKISLTWTGITPIRAYLEPDCDFNIKTSKYSYKFATKENGFYTQKVKESDIRNYIRDTEDGNMYVLFTPTEDGKIYVTDYVEHGNMTVTDCVDDYETNLMTFPTANGGLAMTEKASSKAYRVETSALQNKNIRLKWETTENKLAVAYFANFCGFELKVSDPDVVDTVHLAYNEELQCMSADIPRERINKIISETKDGWLFMQIYRQEAGTFSWDTYEVVYPDCDSKSLLMNPNDSVSMPANNYNTSYKLIASEWSEHAHTFTWQGTRKAYVFIADSCSFPLAPYNVHVGKYMELNPNQTQEISKDEMAKLAADYADEFGNLYLRLRSDAEGVLVTKQVMDNTGLQNTIVADGYTAKLVMINQSLYIEVSKGATTEYYDLVGRPVVIK